MTVEVIADRIDRADFSLKRRASIRLTRAEQS